MVEIQGWLDPVIAREMNALILRIKPYVIVEIGVFAGKSLINSAMALKSNGFGVVYGIDPWRTKDAIKGLSANDDKELWRTIDLDAVHTQCIHATWDCELEDYIVVIRATSERVVSLFADKTIDILYIDGGHSEEVSSLDAEMYMPKVRYCGYIWIDDADWPSVQKAISIVEKRSKLVRDFVACRLYQKGVES